ncbi:MAG: hypothetical protein JSS02_11500 [Planctomycetes bacterium]|nr:hypothetical protein [Planctomycetota bacterium]
MSHSPGASNQKWGLGLLALVLAAGAIYFAMRRVEPQLVADEEVFQTVDALFTALTSRSEPRLEDCEARLEKLCEEGRLPPQASTVLDDVIRQAHAGQWEPAAQRLYDFMLAQRRE